MNCFHCLGKKAFPLSCIGLMHMDLLTGECLVCAGTGEMPPTVDVPTGSLVLDVEKEVDGLCSYIAELEKDKARLDFIEKYKLGGQGWDAKVSHTRGFVINNTKNTGAASTIREAIDKEAKARASSVESSF